MASRSETSSTSTAYELTSLSGHAEQKDVAPDSCQDMDTPYGLGSNDQQSLLQHYRQDEARENQDDINPVEDDADWNEQRSSIWDLEFLRCRASRRKRRRGMECWVLGLLIAAIGVPFLLILSMSRSNPSDPWLHLIEEVDVLQYVDPLIGTGRGGHVFAGATLPFAMAKPVADVSNENHAGFASDGSLITGFSHLHDSGTGGSASMGNFPIFLHPTCIDDTVEKCPFTKFQRPAKYVPASVIASPGYFSLNLSTGIRAQIFSSDRAALYRFSFEPVRDSTIFAPVLQADAGDLLRSKGPRSMFVDADTGRMSGQGRFEPSFGEGTYMSYFCADLKGAGIRDVGGFNSTAIVPNVTSFSGTKVTGPSQGVYVRLKDIKPDDHLMVRVGLSWLSIERACQNAEDQIGDWNWKRLRAEAEESWRKKLRPIRINSTGVATKHLRNFWSGVYRTFISPQDYTGENPLWNSSEPYYDSWYCIWDTFRGVHPFFTLVDTLSQSRMIRSLIDIYKHEGWLPDCRMSLCKGYTQGGSNADVVLVDGFLKGIPDIDWDVAYEALIQDAEEQPTHWNVEGRGGLKSWREIGYIPYQDDDVGGTRTRSVSRTFEYAYNDFCIAEMANATGRIDDYEKYSRRANHWKNLFKFDVESLGLYGFPQPRWSNGKWFSQDPTLCSPINDPDGCFLVPSGHETYEGSPWLYSFFVPQDVSGLADMFGGREAFLLRLEKLHDSGVLYMGDEQAFLTAFLYHYAGRPGLSAKRTHEYIPSMFNDTIYGIPGNDDSGAMGTFVLFSMLGIFPNAGQSVYLLSPPYFPSISITSPQTGKTATIRNVNFDPEYKSIYIQSATLNGKPYTKNWIDHGFFLNGGVLELTLGSNESTWGTEEDDLPPSLSRGLFLG